MIDTKHKAITLLRVPNGFAIYPASGWYNACADRPEIPLFVTQSANDLSKAVQEWAEQQASLKA